jgi:hypothetical protein
MCIKKVFTCLVGDGALIALPVVLLVREEERSGLGEEGYNSLRTVFGVP